MVQTLCISGQAAVGGEVTPFSLFLAKRQRERVDEFQPTHNVIFPLYQGL